MSHLDQGFVRAKRRAADQQAAEKRDQPRRRLSCPVCSAPVSDLESFRKHVLDNPPRHHDLTKGDAIEEAFGKMDIGRQQQSGDAQDTSSPPSKRASDALFSREEASDSDPADTTSPNLSGLGQHSTKKRLSPRASPASTLTTEQSRPRFTAPSSRRSRAAPRNTVGRALWQPDDVVSKPSGTKLQLNKQAAGFSREGRLAQNHQWEKKDVAKDPWEANDPEHMILQPMTRPISQEQIVHEVKTIYSGLVMVENKCIDINASQAEKNDEKTVLTDEQWQALITLHRTLLHEHHDFFLSSQHPSANSALRRLAAKYAMPARMWRHGIHSFLEFLRHNLPESREHMLTFIYLAYSMMALLYETVPAFDETWIECLGDLSRYRMAIEEDDIRDREIWTGVSRHWYSKASEKSPTTGRLYHHLAILARPNALQQLFNYSKSLCVVIPFPSARDSVTTLFAPLLDPANAQNKLSVDAAFVRVEGVLFTGKATKDNLSAWRAEFLRELDSHIGRTGRRWLESGYFIGISLACSLLGFGDEKNALMRAISQRPEEADVVMAEDGTAEKSRTESFGDALSFAVETWSIVIQRWGDLNTLTCHHTMLVFLLHMSRYPAAMVHIEKKIPWKLLSTMFNYLLNTTEYRPKLEDSETENQFAAPTQGSHRPLPDDYALRGLIYAEDYLPKTTFPRDFDEDEKYIEMSSMAEDRVKRILWIGCKIAQSRTWLTWDAGNNEFKPAQEYNVQVEEGPAPAVPERQSPAEVVGES